MPPKRSAQSESVVAPPVTADPLHMIALLSGDDELFLVDRNCALVSRRCLRYIEEVEGFVAAAAAATPGADVMFDATFGSGSQGGSSSACPTPKLRGSFQPSQHQFAQDDLLDAVDDTWKDVRIPFCDFEGQATIAENGSSPLRQPRSVFQQVSIGELLDACRTIATSRQGSLSQQTEAQRPLTGRKSVGSPQKPHMHPFIAITAANGSRLYPVIELPDVPSRLLALGVAFMYYKFQADNDSEKRAPFPSTPLSGSDTAALIAVSTLLEM